MREGLHVDVAIVGAGITGVTAAVLLKEAGRRVAVLEARGVGSGVTGGTTAHLTQARDVRYHELESKLGREGARLAAASSRAAIEQIAFLGVRHGVSSDFAYLPGYLYTERPGTRRRVRTRAECRRATQYATVLETDVFTVLLVPGVLRELDSHKVNHRNVDVREKAKKFSTRIKGWNQGDLTSGVKVQGDIYVQVPHEPVAIAYGVNVYADVRVHGNDRAQLERPCRYLGSLPHRRGAADAPELVRCLEYRNSAMPSREPDVTMARSVLGLELGMEPTRLSGDALAGASGCRARHE